MGWQVRQAFCLAVLIATVAACGKSPSSPTTITNGSGSGTTQTKCGVIVGNKGSVTASVSGSAFTGITPAGGATRVPNALVLFGQSTDDTTLTISTTDAVGTTTVGEGLINGTSIQLQTRSCTQGTGLWTASITGGSGTITVTSVTAAGASGTFSGTLLAQPGTGATGTKTITNGQFNVTF
jgi:hypothetical protein